MERKLAAILAGDVVGYSRLMADNEAATYNNLRSAFDGIVKPSIERHSGRIFKSTGDGFIASFGSANDALDAAVEIQKSIEDHPLKLRMGLNLGDVIEENGDVFGDGVNIAARLEAMAEPGGIYVSAALMRSADKAQDIRFTRIGRRKAKNIPERVEVYAVRPKRAYAAWRIPAPSWQAAALAAGALALVGVGAWGVGNGWLPVIASQVGMMDPAVANAADDARPVVAVLPFDNLSGDPSQNYFADGLTEDIIADLASNRDLMVIARNSTFAFKDRATDIRTVGSELGAGYVVEGSARRAGDQLRVVAQLIDANSGAHLWSRSYDRRVEDVFNVQADLTSEIVASLVSYVRHSETAAAVSRPTEDARAYDLVLRARSSFKHGPNDGSSLREAQALFRRAIELDPEYAAAHAYLGLTFISDFSQKITGEATPATLESGLSEVRESIRLEPDLALGHQVLSYGLSAGGNYEAGLKAAERATELSPSDPDSLMALAKAQVRFGAYDEAVTNAERARRLHPLAPVYYAYVHGQALYAAGRTAEAEQVLAECLVNAPKDPSCLKIRAAALVQLGRVEDARASIADLASAEPLFSLAGEQEYRRFGDSPLMERFLKDLAAAGAVEAAGRIRQAGKRPA